MSDIFNNISQGTLDLNNLSKYQLNLIIDALRKIDPKNLSKNKFGDVNKNNFNIFTKRIIEKLSERKEEGKNYPLIWKNNHIEELIKMLTEYSEIKQLNLSSNFITSITNKDLTALLESGASTIKLKSAPYETANEVEVVQALNDESVQALAKSLNNNSRITNLELESCLISYKGVKELEKTLQNNQTLKTLNLFDNLIGIEGVKYLAKALQKNKTLTTLNLSQNVIDNEGAWILAKLLKKNKTLTNLDLSQNNIGFIGAWKLAGALHSNKTLLSLNLLGNSIGNIGAWRLAEALKVNKALKTLDLRLNEISSIGGNLLIRVLENNNKTITKLDLIIDSRKNLITKRLSDLVEKNKNIQDNQDLHPIQQEISPESSRPSRLVILLRIVYNFCFCRRRDNGQNNPLLNMPHSASFDQFTSDTESNPDISHSTSLDQFNRSKTSRNSRKSTSDGAGVLDDISDDSSSDQSLKYVEEASSNQNQTSQSSSSQHIAIPGTIIGNPNAVVVNDDNTRGKQ
jgi:Ran GTPase-activating protein (RanGAP) involved in mRNA processing and transport